MRVVNLLGGPGCGKSLTAFGLTYRLKCLGVNADFIPEYAKELVYAGDLSALLDQGNILDVQCARLELRRGQVDVAVVDSALVNSQVYSTPELAIELRERTMEAWNRFDNVNFLVRRSPRFAYEQAGRAHGEDQSALIDAGVEKVLRRESIPYTAVPSETAVDDVLQMLGYRIS
jgi:hypothetical protein